MGANKKKKSGEVNLPVSLFFDLEDIDKYMKSKGFMSEDEIGYIRAVQDQIRVNVELMEEMKRQGKEC